MYRFFFSLAPRRVAAVDLKIVLRLSAALLLMNSALIRGRSSLIFLLSYAALNRGRRFIGGGAFSSKYDMSVICGVRTDSLLARHLIKSQAQQLYSADSE